MGVSPAGKGNGRCARCGRQKGGRRRRILILSRDSSRREELSPPRGGVQTACVWREIER